MPAPDRGALAWAAAVRGHDRDQRSTTSPPGGRGEWLGMAASEAGWRFVSAGRRPSVGVGCATGLQRRRRPGAARAVARRLIRRGKERREVGPRDDALGGAAWADLENPGARWAVR